MGTTPDLNYLGWLAEQAGGIALLESGSGEEVRAVGAIVT